MDVDEAGDPTPTNEWMEAAQRAVDTDGILENASAKRQKVCNSCNTLTALQLQTLHKNAHKRREVRQKIKCYCWQYGTVIAFCKGGMSHWAPPVRRPSQ